MRKKIIMAAAAGALALAAGLVLLLTRAGNLGPGPRYGVVYEKGSQNLYVALPEGSFPLLARESARQVFAGHYLYYDDVKDSGTDIYLMDLRDARSRREGGSLLAQGACGAWTVSAGGRFAVWIAAKGSVLWCFDTNKDTRQELASGVDALYACPGQDAFFFTKAQGELFRCNLKLGQRPERMASDAQDVRLFSGEAQGKGQVMAFYLLPAGEEAFDLYALAQEGGGVLVAQNPARVLYDSYALGGNLYFLKRGQDTAGALAIDDPHLESDAKLREPQRPVGSRRPVLSLIAGVLGADEAYRRDKAAYDKKVERDKVREAVQEALEGMPPGDIPMDCYVYDGAGARLLAQGVREDRIALLRAAGRPAMLYERQRGGTQDDEDGGGYGISLEALVAAYRTGGVSAMRDTLYILAGSAGESAGYALAMMAPAGPSEVPMGPGFGGNAGWEAFFLPGRETMLYQERDVEGGLYSIYAYELTDYGLSERRVIDLGAQDVTPVTGGVYYRKRENDAKGSALYYCSQDGRTARAMQIAGAFFPAGELLLAFDGKDTLHSVSGAQARPLDSGVRLEGLRMGDAHVCYLTQWEAGAGTLRLYELGRKNAAAKTLDTGVTGIRLVKNAVQ